YIGVKKEPTLNDLFYMKKIKVLINNFETKYAINKIEQVHNKFKNTFISKILKDSPNKFLCNCVPGFNPEISFYLRDKRIINDLTNNPIDFKQETKIWEYLYKQENRKYIGVKKEPTLNDLFYMKKIKVLINNFETKYAINKIEQVHNK
ncbi:hypothetical protein CP985_10510, partial [Malaciobacter mytili LMG 24559]